MDYISMNSSDDIIEHHGVKGMKWGAVQRHTGAKIKSFTPPSKEILQRQKAEYLKLRAMKKRN